MFKTTIRALSLATLFTSLLFAGCNDSRNDSSGECYADGSCPVMYTCWADYLPDEFAGDPAALALCDGTPITSLTEGFRKTCQSDPKEADDFCKKECIKAAKQNGRSDEDIEILCQYVAGSPDFDEKGNYTMCPDDTDALTTPKDYSPEAVCGNQPCGGNESKSQDIGLFMVEQAFGKVFYEATYAVIDPTKCKNAKVTGLHVNDANNLLGVTVNLLINHKIDQNQTLEDIITDPTLYISVPPGGDLEEGQISELFNGDTTLPISVHLQAFLEYTDAQWTFPGQFYVKLQWTE